jgi:hypothetical protein
MFEEMKKRGVWVRRGQGMDTMERHRRNVSASRDRGAADGVGL